MILFHLLRFSAAFAADQGGEHAAGVHAESHAIPWDAVFVQAFNLTVLIVILFLVLRKTVKTHFAHRARDYQQMVERAEAARVEAEKGKQIIKERLARLEADASQTVTQARAEAEELRSRMLQEAKSIAQRLEQEAARTATVELEKAKMQLRKELLGAALAASRDNMSKNISSSEQQKLQKEFAEKIQVVGG